MHHSQPECHFSLLVSINDHSQITFPYPCVRRKGKCLLFDHIKSQGKALLLESSLFKSLRGIDSKRERGGSRRMWIDSEVRLDFLSLLGPHPTYHPSPLPSQPSPSHPTPTFYHPTQITFLALCKGILINVYYFLLFRRAKKERNILYLNFKYSRTKQKSSSSFSLINPPFRKEQRLIRSLFSYASR